MIVKSTICKNGSVCYKITLTEQENAEIDHCHEILRLRFEEQDTLYTKEQREMCDWWLQGLLRFEGVKRMVSMAQSAPFYNGGRLVLPGSVEAKDVDEAKDSTPLHVRYVRQSMVLSDIASKVGALAFRSGKEYKNMVEFYTVEDVAHNRCVRRQPTQYSRSEADAARKCDGTSIPDECIYRDSFWSFENSDANGSFSWDFANKGKIDLRLPDWRKRVEGHISLALLRKRQIQYVWMAGGWLALQEADEKYNGFNRSIIKAMEQAYGSVYLGCINCDSKQIEQIRAGQGTIYEEYTGQKIYTGSYSFAVPGRDAHLEELICSWNAGSMKDCEQIINRISEIGGEYFRWY